MTNESEVAILFADVVGSTHLYETLGEERARELVTRSLAIMCDATETYEGTVIKTMGDEVLATFPYADSALNAARSMQEQIAQDDVLQHDGGHVAIRIGCHFGGVINEQRDIFGSAVHTANRMTSQAKANQIITTAALVGHLGPAWKMLVREIDVTTVAGKAEEVVLYEVLWQPEEATSMLPSVELNESARKSQRVLLSHGDTLVIVDEQKKSATLGRAEENDVVVNGSLISRIHARVEVHRGKPFLIDESTNGTFVQNTGGEEFFVRRDSTPLRSEGVIGLGRIAQPESPLAIHFAVEDQREDS